MRILIDKSIKVSTTFGLDCSDFENLKDHLQDYTKLCNSLGVVFSYNINSMSYSAEIFPQKIDLEEITLNNFLNQTAWLFNFALEYLPRGSGCGLTMEMTQCEV